MFSQIISLIIILLIVTFAPMANGNTWITSPTTAFLLTTIGYGLLIGAIFWQCRLLKNMIRRRKSLVENLINIELVLFLTFSLYALTVQRFFPESTGLITFFTLTLYFGGMFIFHYAAYDTLPNGLLGAVRSKGDFAFRQISFLIPFTIPFILFSFIVDIAHIFPNSTFFDIVVEGGDTIGEVITTIGLTLFFLLAMILFFPPIIQMIWRCQPLRDKALLERLEALCLKANFRHGGIKTWTIMNHAFTAAIIGVLPRFRYILFTQRLLDELPPDAIEAVLAHEIGHSYRKHLLIYPTIIFGMVVCTGLFTLFFLEAIDTFFILHPSWKPFAPLGILIPYCLIAMLYFRFVFGYFSRLFERQADLHVFVVDLSPLAMQHALDHLGVITGYTHDHPSWHHYSIQQRINYLKAAENTPSIIDRHHRWVKLNLICYTFLVTLGAMILLSPLLNDWPLFHEIATSVQKSSHTINKWINGTIGASHA